MKRKNPEHSTREIHKVGFGDLMDKVSNLLVTDRLVKLLSLMEKRKKKQWYKGVNALEKSQQTLDCFNLVEACSEKKYILLKISVTHYLKVNLFFF